MARYKFQSGFASDMDEYLEFKKACKFNPDGYRPNLNLFDKFCHSKGINEPTIGRKDIDEWVRKRESESDTTHYLRVNAIKLFLIHEALMYTN